MPLGKLFSLLTDFSVLESRLEFHKLKDELLEIQTQYESALADTIQFPCAGCMNRRYILIFYLLTQNPGTCGSSYGELAIARM
jgi:hypothetical protein